MSRYSGKCDLYDYVSMLSIKDFGELNIYMCGSPVRLDIKESKDVIPFYAFVPYFIQGNTIMISDKSCIDKQEQEMFRFTFNEIHKIISRCRVHHLPITWTNVKSCSLHLNDDVAFYIYLYIKDNYQHQYTKEDMYRLLYHLIDKDIMFDGIRTCRRFLYNEMIHNGYSEKQSSLWVYHK